MNSFPRSSAPPNVTFIQSWSPSAMLQAYRRTPGSSSPFFPDGSTAATPAYRAPSTARGAAPGQEIEVQHVHGAAALPGEQGRHLLQQKSSKLPLLVSLPLVDGQPDGTPAPHRGWTQS